MKKFLSFFLAIILMTLYSVEGFAQAADSADRGYIYYKEEYYDERGALHYRYTDEDGNEIDPPEENVVFHSDSVENSTLPSSYDARDYDRVTSVKTQSPFGTCWAHAFCSSAESSLISQGYETKDSIDLSEAHLVWFSFNTYIAGSSVPCELDSYNVDEPFNNGGNSSIAASTVARGSGFTKEADYPYCTNAADMQYGYADRYVSDYNLKSSIGYPSSDRAVIKEAIMKNGALATSYYENSEYVNRSADGYCYYQNIETGTNHGVTVVGWDDSFSASNFKITPPANGAWLIKNSWGPSSRNNGYFWISYYDTSMTEFYEVNAQPAGDYENIYQYDGIPAYSGMSYTSSTAYMANVFTSERSEDVVGTGFFVKSGCTCTAYLYTNLSSATNPTSGTERLRKTVTCPSEGYYYVKFDDEYRLSSGTKFSIVIKTTATTGNASLPIEASSNSKLSYSAASGQSFTSSTGSSWTDVGSKYSGNVPIKVFTNTYVAPTLVSISVDTLPNKTTYMLGDSFSTSGMKIRGFYSDGSSKIVTFISGLTGSVSGFDSDTPGEKTITVSYSGKRTTFTVIVLGSALAELSVLSMPDKTVYNIGESFDATGLVLNALYEDGTTESIPSGYSVSGFSSSTAGTKTVTASYLGKSVTFNVTVECNSHNYVDTVVEPSWTEKGYTLHECSYCGDSYKDNYRSLSGVCGENAHWSFDESTGVLTVSGTGSVTDYVSGSASPFYENAYIKEVNIENGIDSIGSNTFNSCSAITSVSIPESVTQIGSYAFYNTSALNNVIVPDSVKEIDSDAFSANTVIYCYSHSTAHSYARNNNLNYILLDYICAAEGSSLTVDKEAKLISGFVNGIDDLNSGIEISEDVTLSFNRNAERIYTGMPITVLDKDGNILAEYTAVIIGDVNGDGWYDGMDAMIVSAIANGMLTESQAGDAVWKAADCNFDGVINEADVEILEKAGIKKFDVQQTKAAYIIYTDTALHFHVPETIYITPSENTFQYYVNYSAEDLCKTEAQAEATAGNFYFRYSGAAAVTDICVESVSGTDILSITLGGQTLNGGKFNVAGISGADTASINTTITAGSISAHSDAKLKWTLYYTDKSTGAVKNVVAYTYCHVPLANPAGDDSNSVISVTVHPGYQSTFHTKTYTCGTAWAVGLTSVDSSGTGTDGMGSYKCNWLYNRSDVIPTIDNKTISGIFNKGIGGSGYWSTNDNVYDIQGGTGTLYVDSSRYSNVGQIPDFYVGIDCNNREGKTGYLYVSTGWSKDSQTIVGGDTSTARSEGWTSGGVHPNAEIIKGTTTDNTLMIQQWNYSNGDTARTGTGWCYVNIKYRDKSNLREAYNYYIENASALQSDCFAGEEYSTLMSYLDTVTTYLCDPDNTTSQADIDSAALNLYNYIESMTSAVV